MDDDRGKSSGGKEAKVVGDYKLGKVLGHGGCGKVKVAYHKVTNEKVAIKILNRMNMQKQVKREIEIMKLLTRLQKEESHPHVVQFYDVIETPTHIYVVMECLSSADFFEYLMEKHVLKEDEARKFFQQIISGVEFCHKNNIIHRDIKCENLLMDECGSNVKLADFGLSNTVVSGGGTNQLLKTACGTPHYAAPELFSGKEYNGPPVDIWSCGVVLYCILCATFPFDDEIAPEMVKKIMTANYISPTHLSAHAQDLIAKILVADPMKRITIPEIKQHPWFLGHLPSYVVRNPTPKTALLHPQINKNDEKIIENVVERITGFERGK